MFRAIEPTDVEAGVDVHGVGAGRDFLIQVPKALSER